MPFFTVSFISVSYVNDYTYKLLTSCIIDFFTSNCRQTGLRSDRSTSNRVPVLPLVMETGTRAVDVAEWLMCMRH